METSINSRIKTLIDFTGQSHNRFANRIGTSSAVISHIVSGRNKPNIDLIYKIAYSLPNVNIEWLLLGKGEMILDEDKEVDQEPMQKPISEANESPESDLFSEKEGENLDEPDLPKSNEWSDFLVMIEQMLESQRLSYQSMEQQMATQKQILQMLKNKMGHK